MYPVNPDTTRLEVVFRAPGWRRFIDRLRSYRDADQPLPNSVTLETPTSEERRAVAALLRQPLSKGSSLRIDLSAVLASLAVAGIDTSWSLLLDRLCGPVPAARTAERVNALAWKDLWRTALAEAELSPFASAMPWLQKLQRDGVLKRLSAGDPRLGSRLLSDAARLLRALPLAIEDSLARIAAQYFGDSHALDMDRPLSTLVLRGLSQRTDRPMPISQRDKRALWDEYGIVCDDLSAPVLTLNLRFGGNTSLGRIAEAANEAGLPLHLTTRLLWKTSWKDVVCPERVFVCENPAVVSLAADRLGVSCAPLVCVDGEPKTASRILLGQLRDAGTALYYHGDYDWAGLSIASRVMKEFGARPWRFTTLEYNAVTQSGRPLIGSPVDTPWDDGLRRSMQYRGVAFDEEVLAETLFADLGLL